MDRRHFISRGARAAAAIGALQYAGGCRPDSGTTAAAADANFTALRDRYFLRTLEYNPVTSTYLGGDGYDPSLSGINGRLRDYGSSALTLEARFYGDTRAELSGMHLEDLSPASQVDYRVMNAQLGFLLHQHDRRYYQRAVDTYVGEPFRGIDWQIQQMTAFQGEELGSVGEWELVLQRLDAIPQYLATARTNLLAGRSDGNLPDHRMVRRDGIGGSLANAEYFRTTLPRTASTLIGTRPFGRTMLDRVAAAGAEAADAYTGFAGFLEQTFAGSLTDRFALGEEEYQWRLANCLRVQKTPQELFDHGAEQVSLYESKLFEVAEEVARGAQLGVSFSTEQERRNAVRTIMVFLGNDAPRNDNELFRWYQITGERAVAYGREHEMFNIPEDYQLDVVPTPPVLRSTIEAAYYPAPPFKQSGVGRFYLTPTDNNSATLKLNNRASVATTAIHEGFPGHDWHFKYMTEHSGKISNIRWLTPGSVEDSSAMWEDSMATEGWGLYAEELMSVPVPGRPHGFYSAAEHLYELQAQLLRAVRVRVDSGMHTGRMSFSEARDYFTEHVNFYPGACAARDADPDARAICDGADRAIYRYSKWPTQAVTYNLGKNDILSLRDAHRQTVGQGWSPRIFHEEFMEQGTIPVGYFREVVLDGGGRE